MIVPATRFNPVMDFSTGSNDAPMKRHRNTAIAISSTVSTVKFMNESNC